MTVLKERTREKKSPRDVLCPGVYAQRSMGGSCLATSFNKLLLYGSPLQDHEYPLGELLKIMFRSHTKSRSLEELGEMNFLKGLRNLGPTPDLLNQTLRLRPGYRTVDEAPRMVLI